MRTWSKVALLAFCAGLPMLMAPSSSGIPSRPRFQAIGVNSAVPANGSITASGTITAADYVGNVGGVASLDFARLSQAVQVNGVVIATQASGTQAMTQTGCAGGASSPNVRWVRTGNIVTLELPTVACTSNSTSWSWSGLPASIRPAGGWVGAPLGCIINNGVQECGNGAVGVQAAGIIDFLRNGSVTGWTNTGARNIAHFTSITYGVL